MRRARYFLVAAFCLGACGGDADSDRGDLERDLVRTVEQQTGTKDVTVDCRDDRPICDVTAPGGVRAKVTRDGKLVQP